MKSIFYSVIQFFLFLFLLAMAWTSAISILVPTVAKAADTVTNTSESVQQSPATSKHFLALGGGGSARAEEDWNGYLGDSFYSSGFVAYGYQGDLHLTSTHWFRLEYASAYYQSGNAAMQVELIKRNYSLWYAYDASWTKWLRAYFEAGVGVSQQEAQTQFFEQQTTDKGRWKPLLGVGFGIRPDIPWGWLSVGMRSMAIQGEKPSPTLEAIVGLGIHTR